MNVRLWMLSGTNAVRTNLDTMNHTATTGAESLDTGNNMGKAPDKYVAQTYAAH